MATRWISILSPSARVRSTPKSSSCCGRNTVSTFAYCCSRWGVRDDLLCYSIVGARTRNDRFRGKPTFVRPLPIPGSALSARIERDILVGVRRWNGSCATSPAASVDRLRRSRCEPPVPACRRQIAELSKNPAKLSLAIRVQSITLLAMPGLRLCFRTLQLVFGCGIMRRSGSG